ncbi:uncharacterized protein AAG666_015293 [Megaptera novaeangliae]
MLYLISQESAPKSMNPYSDLNVLATLIKQPQSFLPGKLAWLLPRSETRPPSSPQRLAPTSQAARRGCSLATATNLPATCPDPADQSGTPGTPRPGRGQAHRRGDPGARQVDGGASGSRLPPPPPRLPSARGPGAGRRPGGPWGHGARRSERTRPPARPRARTGEAPTGRSRGNQGAPVVGPPSRRPRPAPGSASPPRAARTAGPPRGAAEAEDLGRRIPRTPAARGDHQGPGGPRRLGMRTPEAARTVRSGCALAALW